MKKLLLSLIIISAITSCAKKEDEIKSESSNSTSTDNSSSINCENYVFDNSSITDNTSLSNLDTKVQNRPTVPVFYPWSGSGQGIYNTCGESNNVWFDCDNETTPYSLIWTNKGRSSEVESADNISINDDQKKLMKEDNNTLYLISEQWHYYNPKYDKLSQCSKFYLNEVFKEHEGTEYDHNLMINILHDEWPVVLSNKAAKYKNEGFDGILFDWWHNWSGNCKDGECVRSTSEVESARLAIAKEIRQKVGNDFIIMGNVNWIINDPVSQYMSGVFLELWKTPTDHYPSADASKDNASNVRSIEAMEVILNYWNENLMSPKIIAFEPWKYTTNTQYTNSDNHSDQEADRTSEVNVKLAKLFTAMGLVIPDNGYVLYADNNPDWSGGDHQHHYYDFWKTDLGKPVDNMTEVKSGVAYKKFEKGVVAYNRTSSTETITLDNGSVITLESKEGKFVK